MNLFGFFIRPNSNLSVDNRELLQRTIHATPRRDRFSNEMISKTQVGWRIHFDCNKSLVRAFVAARISEQSRIQYEDNGSAYANLRRNLEHEAGLRWGTMLKPHVAIRDCLDASFALDFNKIDGRSSNSYTEVGSLVRWGKVYRGKPSARNHNAAKELAERCLDFISKVDCYASVDAVMSVAGSRRSRKFTIQNEVVKIIANALQLEDLSSSVKLAKRRRPQKTIQLNDKVANVNGTLRINKENVSNKRILLIDDLYQSGVTMNHQGLILKQLGASEIFGLAFVKTCGDRDNT